jgi:hypothetical protein
MKHEEMNKFTVWLLAAFPQWKVDERTTTVWATELPDISADVAIRAVRVIRKETPSQFPPGVFEIVAALTPQDPGAAAWTKVSERVWYTGRQHEELTDREREALRLIGGARRLSEVQPNDEPFVRKEFISIYEDLKGEVLSIEAPRRTSDLEPMGNVLQLLAKKA